MPRSYQVLAVDDTPGNLQILSEVLSAEGYQVRVAVSGEAALASVAASRPDLVLLDVRMPGISGLEVCRLLKSSDAQRSVPVIFLSAAGEPEDIAAGFAAGGADYVTKPFRVVELLARVRAHLEIHAARENQARLIAELREALENVKLLSGLVPICAQCKKIRNDTGFWQQMEIYIETHSMAKFSHGMCPDCIHSLYPELAGHKHPPPAPEQG
jgi:DNA-binding response OmpR family regulator